MKILGIDELKKNIEVTETTVECPVKGCSEKVERQREVFKREERFRCPKHKIYQKYDKIKKRSLFEGDNRCQDT